MEPILSVSTLPDVSAGQRASNELVKLIRKLRWIGEEAEAKELELALRGMPHLGGVLAMQDALQHDTD